MDQEWEKLTDEEKDALWASQQAESDVASTTDTTTGAVGSQPVTVIPLGQKIINNVTAVPQMIKGLATDPVNTGGALLSGLATPEALLSTAGAFGVGALGSMTPIPGGTMLGSLLGSGLGKALSNPVNYGLQQFGLQEKDPSRYAFSLQDSATDFVADAVTEGAFPLLKGVGEATGFLNSGLKKIGNTVGNKPTVEGAFDISKNNTGIIPNNSGGVNAINAVAGKNLAQNKQYVAKALDTTFTDAGSRMPLRAELRDEFAIADTLLNNPYSPAQPGSRKYFETKLNTIQRVRDKISKAKDNIYGTLKPELANFKTPQISTYDSEFNPVGLNYNKADGTPYGVFERGGVEGDSITSYIQEQVKEARANPDLEAGVLSEMQVRLDSLKKDINRSPNQAPHSLSDLVTRIQKVTEDIRATKLYDSGTSASQIKGNVGDATQRAGYVEALQFEKNVLERMVADTLEKSGRKDLAEAFQARGEQFKGLIELENSIDTNLGNVIASGATRQQSLVNTMSTGGVAGWISGAVNTLLDGSEEGARQAKQLDSTFEMLGANVGANLYPANAPKTVGENISNSMPTVSKAATAGLGALDLGSSLARGIGDLGMQTMPFRMGLDEARNIPQPPPQQEQQPIVPYNQQMEGANVPPDLNLAQLESVATANEYTKLPRDTDRFDNKAQAMLLASRAGSPEQPIASGMIKEYQKYTRMGDVFQKRLILSDMTRLFPDMFEDGQGVDGRILDPEEQKRHMAKLRSSLELGTIGAEDVARQMAEFANPYNSRIVPVNPPKKTVASNIFLRNSQGDYDY